MERGFGVPGCSGENQKRDKMGYRWKPSAADKAEYRAKIKEREKLPIVQPSGAIRKGCKVEYYSLNHGHVISGTVIKHSYGQLTNQHTFTIDSFGYKILVKGRNLYPNLLKHEPGNESIEQSK